jgi:hypothetical protein
VEGLLIWEQKVPGWALGMRKGTYIGGKMQCGIETVNDSSIS